jgi:hypothetical protein
MGQHLAVFHFLTGGLSVQGELLGEGWCLEREGFRMVVSLPSGPDDFAKHIPKDDFDPLVSKDSWRGSEILSATVKAFQIAVVVESDVSSADPKEADKSDGQRALNEAFEVAFLVAEDFLTWLRVAGGQFWLLASHEPPRTEGTADLIDLETGRRVPNIGWDQGIIVSSMGGLALSREGLAEIVAKLREGAKAGTPEQLLADAQETLGSTSVERQYAAGRRDVRRAVLLAAIACEVKIKDTLRDKTPDDRRPLVEVLLKNWRELDVAIAQLPHTLMREAVGRSLHEDDPTLFASVEKLFKRRNDIAHRGDAPPLDEARSLVSAAARLFTWLDDLPSASAG